MSVNVSQDLTRNQVRAIAALLAHRRIEDAARSIGINEKTIYRWMQDAAFMRALRSAESEFIGDAVRVLISDLKANQEVMREIRDNSRNSARVRLSAAQSLDNSTFRWRELENVDQRLTDLEAAVYGKERG